MRPIMSCAISAILLATSIDVATGAVPIRLTTGFGSGAIALPDGDVGGFDISIRPNGKTSISTFTLTHGHLKKATRTVSLAPAQLDSIARAVTDNRFFQLPSEMEGGAEDSPAYTLDITIGGQHKHVRVHAPAFFSDKSLLRRFRLVWVAMSRAAGFTRDGDALHHLTVNS
jgi:hypothetical protein